MRDIKYLEALLSQLLKEQSKLKKIRDIAVELIEKCTYSEDYQTRKDATAAAKRIYKINTEN